MASQAEADLTTTTTTLHLIKNVHRYCICTVPLLCFDKSRQMTAENAHKEMFIAENGPILVRADNLLKRALDRYFLEETKKKEWHFYHSDQSRHHQAESLTVRRLKMEKSKLSFVDK